MAFDSIRPRTRVEHGRVLLMTCDVECFHALLLAVKATAKEETHHSAGELALAGGVGLTVADRKTSYCFEKSTHT